MDLSPADHSLVVLHWCCHRQRMGGTAYSWSLPLTAGHHTLPVPYSLEPMRILCATAVLEHGGDLPGREEQREAHRAMQGIANIISFRDTATVSVPLQRGGGRGGTE